VSGAPDCAGSPAAAGARGRGGTGLGLAIVELIAQAHGGSAGAANRPEGGADVWLAVPAAEVSRKDRFPLTAAQSS
jgi:K+-sensing histidine kinase KdpD